MLSLYLLLLLPDSHFLSFSQNCTSCNSSKKSLACVAYPTLTLNNLPPDRHSIHLLSVYGNCELILIHRVCQSRCDVTLLVVLHYICLSDFVERSSPSSVEEAGCYDMSCLSREQLGSKLWTASRSWGTHFYSCKGLNLANNHMHLEENTRSRNAHSLADTLTTALWDPEQRSQLNCVQTPDSQKLWDNESVLF